MENPAYQERPEIGELAARMEHLAAGEGDPQQGISLCLALLVELMKAERGFILLAAEGGSGLVPYAGSNVDLENILINEEVSQTIIQTVVEKQEPLLTTNAMQDPRFADRISVLIAGLRSVLCVPLSSDRGFFGLMYLDNRSETGFFKKKDRDYLTESSRKLSAMMETCCSGLVYLAPVAPPCDPEVPGEPGESAAPAADSPEPGSHGHSGEA